MKGVQQLLPPVVYLQCQLLYVAKVCAVVVVCVTSRDVQ
jgi:hypothetical protein